MKIRSSPRCSVGRQKLSRPLPGNRLARSRLRRLMFEPLEQRAMLDVSGLGVLSSVETAAGDDQIISAGQFLRMALAEESAAATSASSEVPLSAYSDEDASVPSQAETGNSVKGDSKADEDGRPEWLQYWEIPTR